jgi:hypothetical protein
MVPRWTGCRMAAAGALALMLGGCQPPETRLDVTLAAQPQDVVAVTGTTSLPDGAQLNVALSKPGAQDPIVLDLPVVKGGRFEARLDPKRDLPPGTYQVRVTFSPQAFAWSDQVKPAVGERGEKLGGPHVKQAADGLRVLELDRPIELK